MQVQPGGAFWDSVPADDQRYCDFTDELKKLLIFDESYDSTSHFTKWLSAVEHVDARTAFRQLARDGDRLEAPELPQPVQGEPPRGPHSFFRWRVHEL